MDGKSLLSMSLLEFITKNGWVQSITEARLAALKPCFLNALLKVKVRVGVGWGSRVGLGVGVGVKGGRGGVGGRGGGGVGWGH